MVSAEIARIEDDDDDDGDADIGSEAATEADDDLSMLWYKQKFNIF